MKINVTLKDEQKEFLDQVINDYSLDTRKHPYNLWSVRYWTTMTMKMFLVKSAVSEDVSQLMRPFQLNWRMNR